MESSRVQGGGKETEERAERMMNNPKGLGFRPKRHKLPMKGTGATHNAKRKGKRGGRGK